MANALHPFPRRAMPALAVLRLSLGVFLLLWALEKFFIPDTTVSIWKTFYRIEITPTVPYVLGTAEAILAVALIMGAWRRVTYGLALTIHALSTISTWKQLVDPWGLIWGTRPNHLFLAGVPVLAAFIALYLLRDWDVWSVDGRRARRAQPPPVL